MKTSLPNAVMGTIKTTPNYAVVYMVTRIASLRECAKFFNALISLSTRGETIYIIWRRHKRLTLLAEFEDSTLLKLKLSIENYPESGLPI